MSKGRRPESGEPFVTSLNPEITVAPLEDEGFTKAAREYITYVKHVGSLVRGIPNI